MISKIVIIYKYEKSEALAELGDSCKWDTKLSVHLWVQSATLVSPYTPVYSWSHQLSASIKTHQKNTSR